jgi:hypothetical protein
MSRRSSAETSRTKRRLEERQPWHRAAARSRSCARRFGPLVPFWNARQAGGRALCFYPTIGAAIAADLPWLSFARLEMLTV